VIFLTRNRDLLFKERPFSLSLSLSLSLCLFFSLPFSTYGSSYASTFASARLTSAALRHRVLIPAHSRSTFEDAWPMSADDPRARAPRSAYLLLFLLPCVRMYLLSLPNARNGAHARVADVCIVPGRATRTHARAYARTHAITVKRFIRVNIHLRDTSADGVR